MSLSPDQQLHQRVCAFLYRESRLLDDRQWDDWLACYAPDVVYWMPAWTDDDELTDDPFTQISLIYYGDRRGLEDRIYRLRTNRSSASMPEPRTAHFIANVEVADADAEGITVRYSWHTLSYRMHEISQFFGTTTLKLRETRDGFLIAAKKIVLKNDYIHQVIDICHV